ncbi:MAG: response regulator transcription factor [Verrucomicrobia bacterium]|nr:response regulator transcription factor [Verrucomicrobiota bacterium]
MRVLVADENTLIRAGICSLLEKLPNVELVGETEAGAKLLPAIKKKRPDVLLIEVGSIGLGGLGLISQVARQHAEVSVIVLSSLATEEFLVQCLKAGAVGYLLKRSEIRELDLAIRAAAQGSKYLCDAMAGRFKDSVTDYSGESAFERLTTRQRQILKLIAEGRNTKEIALLMKLSPKTVAFHRVQLMQRLNIDNVPGLVRYAIRVGLVAA